MSVSDEDAAFSTSEVARALRRLSSADMVRLSELSRVWSRRVDPSLGDDLLNEAIQRALDGRRRWPTSLDLLTFMSGAMRSIASEWRTKALRERAVAPEDIDLIAAPHIPDQEAATALSGVAQRMQQILRDHPVALAIFTHRATGATERQICATLNLDERAYDTDYRRVQRELLRLFPEGCPL